MSNNNISQALISDAQCVIELMVHTEVALDGILSKFELEATCKEQEDAVMRAKELYSELRRIREAAGFSMRVRGGNITLSSRATGDN